MRIAFVYNLQKEFSLAQAEFDTQETIDSIAYAIGNEGDEVIRIEMTQDGTWIQELVDRKPDLIFNTAEGFHGIGRESLAPIVFDQLSIPYVGSGPYGCFLTLDKFLTKQVVASRGVVSPEGYFISSPEELEAIVGELSFPVFVKPNFEGSSKGITDRSLCQDIDALKSYALESLQAFPEGILIEKYIPGKDVTVGFIEGLGQGGVLSPIEYVGPKRGGEWIYDYALKNQFDEQVGVKCPADIPASSVKLIQKYMKSVVQSLAAVDMGRADFRVTPTGEVYFIEFNALPSLQPGAGIFEATKQLELSYAETIQKIISAAIDRYKLSRVRIRPIRKMPTKSPNVALVYNLRRKSYTDEDYAIEAEFDSQKTIDAILAAIEKNGYKVVPIEADKNLAAHLIKEKIDVVFNIAEGLNRRGREAQVPALCDLLGIEHTGSDVTCLAVTLDKAMTTKLVSSEGILAPRSKVFQRVPKSLKLDLSYPLIVKPNVEGTSKGIFDSSVGNDEKSVLEAMGRLSDSGIKSILVEEYIVGREFTVGLLGFPSLHVLGPTEIEFKRGKFPVYSFEAKQLDDQLDNDHFRMVCPAKLTPEQMSEVTKFAKKCFKTLGARDVARIDFRINAQNQIYFIEINPLPGLSPGFSDLTIMAEKTGTDYSQLIGSILTPAVKRWRRSYRQNNRK